jgi:hypothetical protein
MAPEQAVGNVRAIGPATDVYSLGVILYEMLTGRTPFEGDAGPKLLKQIEIQVPTPPRQWRPEVPGALEAVCLKCLEKDPRRRYASAQELADDLERWRRAEQPRANRFFARVRRRVRRHVLASLVGFLLILAASVTSLTSYYRDPERQLECIQRQLANGHPVELIGATGPPSWHHVRVGQTDTAIWAGADKPFTLYSANIFLVELLRAPPIPAYRIRAEICHESMLLNHRHLGVGIYFLCSGQEVDPVQHWFATLSFNNVTEYGLPQGNPVKFDIWHILRHEGGPWLKWNAGPQPPITYFTPSGQNAWRQLSVEVHPTEVVLQWEKEPPQTIAYQDIDTTADIIRRGQAEQNPGVIPAAFGPRTSLGLYVFGGTAAFRNVVVEPLARE